MRRTNLALLIGAAACVVGAACSSETAPNPVGTGGASSGTSASSGSGGDNTGGQGGGGGGTPGMKLQVGVGKQNINPMLVETDWTDLNDNDYWEENEPFVDTNMNMTFDATWIAGFDGGRPAVGINDDLEVRAIALKFGDQTVVICVLDVVGYFVDEMDRIRMDPIVAALDVDHIIISSTHTHEAVDTIGLWGPDPMVSGLNPEYQKLTRDRAALAIKDAVESLKPARMRVAQTQTVDSMTGSTLAYHNDTRDPIIYDPTVTIAQFTDDADPTKTIATLVNWAAHPEYAGSRNNLISADYVHWLREVVEEGVPAEGVSGLGGTTVFVQGPLGGQVGPGGGVAPLNAMGMPITDAGLAKAQAAGTNVAKLALSAISTGEDATSTEITLRTADLSVRIDNVAYHFGFMLGLFDRQLYDFDPNMPISETNVPYAKMRITYFQVGPLAMITNPGELHPELWVGGYDGFWSWGQDILNEQQNKPDLTLAPSAPYLRDIMLTNPGAKYVFTAGLAEDFIGYIVPAFNYVLDMQNPYISDAAGDHYEETNSLGPLVEEQIQHPMMDLAKPPTP
jgi:hypothetical protein